jgi:alpha-1,3-glucan synthase
MQYDGKNTTLSPQVWSGTKAQSWTGEHVVLNFWSEKTGSSEHIQHSDLNRGNLPPRRWPHAFVMGSWNQYGYDNGLKNDMQLDNDGLWKFNMMAEWPTEIVLNVWGMNPDGFPDKTRAFGDVDGDGVLDWEPPDSLAYNAINVTSPPPMPYLGFRIIANDGNWSYQLEPAGSAWNQLVLAILLAIIPFITAVAGVWLFKRSFYQVKFNKVGVSEKQSFMETLNHLLPGTTTASVASSQSSTAEGAGPVVPAGMSSALIADTGAPNRRTVLIATMEYEIEDWNIKVKIGGLGVMASLMGKNLGHQDLIWVVPCVGDIEYPTDTPGEVMTVKILGNTYEIEVQYHKLRNITFVLLDSPVFRRQTKAEPYPARMDDLDSAIFYSAWNTCISKALRRFPVDIYHINDYHGAVAPLHLLPRTIPVCLSLHNAEFQGLWPLRNDKEMDEICRVFNLSEEIVRKYVQFGEVFNLLHAGASYLHIHQKGFGAVGVSKKYGKRSFARYPIFWGLKSIGALPNPDPSDTGEWNKKAAKIEATAVEIDEASQVERRNLRVQAQEWAGLDVDPTVSCFPILNSWTAINFLTG